MGSGVWAELGLIALVMLLTRGTIIPEDLMDEDIKTGTAVPLAQWEPIN